MKRVKFEPESGTDRQVIRQGDLTAMQDLPAKYVHDALRLLHLTDSSGTGVKFKIFGLKGLAKAPTSGKVILTKGAGAVSNADKNPLVNLLADTDVFILDAAVIRSPIPTAIDADGVVFDDTGGAAFGNPSQDIFPGYLVQPDSGAASPNGDFHTIIKIEGLGTATAKAFVEATLTINASPTNTAPMREPGEAADATNPRIDLVTIEPVEARTDDAFTDADETVSFVDVAKKEGDPARAVSKGIRTRYADGYVIHVFHGTPAAVPTAPTVPDGQIACFQVSVGAGVTVITQDDILDLTQEVDAALAAKFGQNEFDITAGEDLSAFKLFYIKASDNLAYLATSAETRAKSVVVGMIPPNGSISISTNPKGKGVRVGIYQKAGSSFTPGERLYLTTSGNMTDEATIDAAGDRWKNHVALALTNEIFALIPAFNQDAEDIPVVDTVSDFTAKSVEGVLHELKSLNAGGAGSLGRIAMFGQATPGNPVLIPANSAPNFVYLLASAWFDLLNTEVRSLIMSKDGGQIDRKDTAWANSSSFRSSNNSTYPHLLLAGISEGDNEYIPGVDHVFSVSVGGSGIFDGVRMMVMGG